MHRPGDRAADARALTVAPRRPGTWPAQSMPLDERGCGTAVTVAVSLVIFFLAVAFAIVVNAYPAVLPWMQ
jgi:hypothetical protein